MSVLQWLDKIDKKLFTIIHADGAVPSIDWLMLLLRNSGTWVPLYILVLLWAVRYAKKYVIKFTIISALTAGIADQISSSLLKPLFARSRPCYDEVLAPVIRNIIGCSGQYSMPSGHATNHFAMATLWFFCVLLITGKRWYWLWLWAAMVCYAQIYVGKHYPFDILVGACLGASIGYLMYRLFRRWAQVEPSMPAPQ